MKFTCEKSLLANALSNVQKAVATRSTIPALEGVLIKTIGDNSIELCAYNTEMGIKTNIQANIYKPGETVINSHIFTEIIKKSPCDTVEIDIKENFLIKIKAGQSYFELIGINPEDFPNLPNVSQTDSIKLSVDTVRSMIKQTIFAISDNDSKPAHTGTLFEISDGEIVLVSVDGFRLAMRKEKIQERNLEYRFIVPGKTLRELLRLLPSSPNINLNNNLENKNPENSKNNNQEEKYVKITTGMRHILFEVENYIIISRLLDGEFLDYQATIPENSVSKIRVSTSDFIESIERVSLMISDRLKSPVRSIFSKDKINLSCCTNLGKSSDELDCTSNIQNDEFKEIAFNSKYMSESLKYSDCDEVYIYLNSNLSPMKITPVSGDQFLFLVLPVRIKPENNI